MENKVRFVRIHGRVVPIRPKKDDVNRNQPAVGDSNAKKVAKGAAFVAAGATAGAFAGRFAARHTLEAAHFENSARSMAKTAKVGFEKAMNRITRASAKGAGAQLAFNFGDDAYRAAKRNYGKTAHLALKSMTESARMFRSRLPIKNLGGLAAGGLIGIGAKKIYESTTGKPSGLRGDAIVAGSTAAGAIAVNAGYIHHLSGGKLGAVLSKAIKAARFVK